jgi:hypothetical protein
MEEYRKFPNCARAGVKFEEVGPDYYREVGL